MKLKSIFPEKKSKDRIWNLKRQDREKRMDKISKRQEEFDGPIYITAQLSRKNYMEVLNGYASLEVPHGVEMENKAGSRDLNFICQDESVAEELINGLDASGIPWEEDNASEDVNLGDILR
jgi:hypothetical protein